MIFFAGNDGTLFIIVPSPVYQGAANANNIYLIAPFAENLSVSVAFKLPNGVITERYPMTPLNEIQGVVNEKTGQAYSGWSFSMPNEITVYVGTVTAQFFFYAAQGGIITPSSYVSFPVGQGVPNILPAAPSTDVYDIILENISALQQQLNNGAYASRAIYAWNSQYTYGAGEITYYPDVGSLGAFVKSKTTGNKNQPPYDADGNLNSQYWEVVLNFDNLTKAIVLWGFNQAVDISELDWEVK